MPRIPGKFVWFEHVSKDPKKAQAFYGEVLGWKIERAPMGDFTYEMIKAGNETIGGYAQPQAGDDLLHQATHLLTAQVAAIEQRA